MSLRGLTYQRFKDYADEQKKSMSGCLEDLITEKLDAAQVPVPTQVSPTKPKNNGLDPDELEAIADEHFTF